MNTKVDPEIMELIPHRPPMLLINSLVSVGQTFSESIVSVDEDSPFFESGMGVPAWIGMEYMGQTAALIAGYQMREGLMESHLGFLMACRKYETAMAYFTEKQSLRVKCKEAAVVGENLATFTCSISDDNKDQEIATAMLSVFRKPLNEL